MSAVGRFNGYWPRLRRPLGWVFFALVIGLLAFYAREVDWPAIGEAVQQYPSSVLLSAIALALLSHGIYTVYDLIGRSLTGHRLGTGQVMAVAHISYALNLNLGSLVGGFAMRYRLYSRLGLEPGIVTRILGYSLLTNWLGYLVAAGCLFVWRPLELPGDWRIAQSGLRALGVLLLLLAVAYLLACGFARRREWRLRGQPLVLPSGRIALLQALVGASNWLVIGAVVFTLLQFRIDYPTVVTVLLLAAVAGVVTHVPAGLGVLELVFVTLLSGRLPQTELLAALLSYRAIYYLLPLLIALVALVIVETGAIGRRRVSVARTALPTGM